MAAGIIRGVVGAARYPALTAFAIGSLVGLLMVVGGLAMVQLAYRRNYSVRGESGELF